MVSDKSETIETVSAEVNRLGKLLSKQAQQIISMSSRLHDLELMLSGKMDLEMDLELKSEPIRLAGKGGTGKGGKGSKGGKGGKGGKIKRERQGRQLPPGSAG